MRTFRLRITTVSGLAFVLALTGCPKRTSMDRSTTLEASPGSSRDAPHDASLPDVMPLVADAGQPPGKVTTLAGGSGATCALHDDVVWCWGRSLGIKDMRSIDKPERVEGIADATQLSVSSGHACAIANGAAYCWGDNRWGEVGDGTTTERARPVAVLELSRGVTMIAAGQHHSCAIVDGAAWCWGHGNYGQLGDGGTRDIHRPVRVRGLESGVTSIAVWSRTSCAIVRGEVMCWGEDEAIPTPGLPRVRRTATRMPDFIPNPRALVARGYAPACVLNTEAQIRCFEGRASPCAESELVTIARDRLDGLDVEGDRRCRSTGAEIRCPYECRTAAPVVLPDVPTKLVVDEVHVCALVHGEVYCWGSTFGGGLGDGTKSPPTLPEGTYRGEPRRVVFE